MRRVTILCIAVSFLLLSGACAKKGDQKGPYLAKVGSEKITEQVLEKELKNLPEFAQQLFEGQEGKQRFLDELIKKELLYQEAKKKGLAKDPDFQSKLEEFKKITLIGVLLEKEIEEKAAVTEQEVKEYYEKNKSDFSNVNQIRASHILVKSKEEAQKVLQRLKAGEDFGKIAKEKSLDPGSARNGGDVGFFSSGQMVPEFESAASRLKVGETSQPVKTKFGYHVIRVTDKKVGQPVDFDKVRNLIYQRLSAEKQKGIFDSYIEDLKQKFKVDINEQAVSQLGAGEAPAEDPVTQEKTEGK